MINNLGLSRTNTYSSSSSGLQIIKVYTSSIMVAGREVYLFSIYLLLAHFFTSSGGKLRFRQQMQCIYH